MREMFTKKLTLKRHMKNNLNLKLGEDLADCRVGDFMNDEVIIFQYNIKFEKTFYKCTL